MQEVKTSRNLTQERERDNLTRFKNLKAGKFPDGKTPSQIKVGTEIRLPSGSVAYKADSNNWAINDNGVNFTESQKANARMFPRQNAIFSNFDMKRILKSYTD